MFLCVSQVFFSAAVAEIGPPLSTPSVHREFPHVQTKVARSDPEYSFRDEPSLRAADKADTLGRLSASSSLSRRSFSSPPCSAGGIVGAVTLASGIRGGAVSVMNFTSSIGAMLVPDRLRQTKPDRKMPVLGENEAGKMLRVSSILHM